MTQALIVGLGNPGKKYERTRHNIGFRIVKAFAAKYSIPIKPALIRAKGALGEMRRGEDKVRLLLPLTYMNESGLAVDRCSRYYKISLDRILIISDDKDLPLGKLRLRSQGSCGGHNGLRSIEQFLGPKYWRLRFGIGDKQNKELAEFVLDTFTQEEDQILDEKVADAVDAIDLWLTDKEKATEEVNRSKPDAKI